MIVDSSALIAMLLYEPERDELVSVIAATDRCSMSAASWLEAAMVVDGRNDPVLSRRFDELVRVLHIDIATVTPAQAAIARRAFRDFGKGRHRAGLNFGDCFSYALASELCEPLLFKGDDFGHTDLEVVDLGAGRS
ncbi:MAG: type II toxin-antitoxin system VapC family toxin [Lapillicoccus sp.]